MPATSSIARNARGGVPAASRQIRHRGRRSTVLALVIWALQPAAPAAPFALTDEFVIDNWQTEDGLPENSATAMVQMADGHLWFSTFNGLVRFDGSTFRVFDGSNTPELPARRIANLHLARDGNLWISYEQGMAVYRDGRFSSLPPGAGYAGSFVRTFSEAPDGTLHVTTFDGRIYRARDRQFTELPSPDPQMEGGWQGATDADGRFYVLKARKDRQYFGFWNGDAWERLEPGVPIVDGSNAVGTDRDGAIWLLTQAAMQQWVAGMKIREVPLTESISGLWSFHADSDGRYWVPTYDRGLYRIEADGTVFRFTTANGLSYDSVRFVFEDRVGNRWVGTSGGGLLRFFKRRVSMLGPEQGLTENVVKSVAALPDGRLAVGTWGKGLFLTDPPSHTARPYAGKIFDWIEAVETDAQGRLVVGTFGDGVWRIEGQGPRQLWLAEEAGPEMTSLFRDRRGRIWASGNRGVTVVDGEERETYPNPIIKGSTNRAPVIALAELPDGRLIAGNRTGLHEFSGDGFKPFDIRSGPLPSEVMALAVDDRGRLWIGSSLHGLYVVQNGASGRVGEAQGLPTRSVTGLLVDDLRRLWLATNRGLVAAHTDDLEAVALGRQPRIQLLSLGREDGMSTDECSTSHQPLMARTADGALWVATIRGVARTQPGTIAANSVPPGIRVNELRFSVPVLEAAAGTDQFQVETRRVSVGPGVATVVLPPGSRYVELDYSALQFTHPRRVRFETRLLGVAGGRWQFVDDRRVAVWPDLPPGDYEFQARAFDHDGLVSPVPATVAFVIQPYYWQAWWFRGAVAAAVLASGLGSAGWLVRRRRSHALALEQARASVRERYVRVIDSSSDFICFASPEQDILYLNRAARQALGLADDEAVGRLKLGELQPDWVRRLHVDVTLPAAMRDGSWRGRSSWLSRSGKEINVWQTVVAHRPAGGNGAEFISLVGQDLRTEQQARVAIRTSEEKFSKAFHASPDAIGISSLAEGRFIDLNEGFERLFGLTRAEVLGKHGEELGLWLDVRERVRLFRLFHDAGRVRNFEAGIRRAGQRPGTALISVEGVELAGEPCLITIFRDITDRKAAESSLESSRNMLRQVLDSIPVRVFWKDRESVFLGGNRLWATDGGFENADDLIGKTDFDFSTRTDAEAYRADDRVVMETGVPKLRYEESRQSPAGELRWLLTSKIPMRGPHGNVVGILGLYEDITERKRMELALRESEAKLSLAVSAAQMGIWEWDVRKNVVLWSDRAAEIFGVQLAEFGGTLEDYQSRIHPDDLSMVGARINEALHVGAPDYRVEHRIKWPDGAVRWIEARGRVYRDAEGRAERMAGLVWDVTPRKVAESDLLRLAQGVGGLSGASLVDSVLATLSAVTGADYAFLGRLEDGHFIQTIAVYVDGKPAAGMRYNLANSPCARVMQRETCVFPSGVQAAFPGTDLLTETGVEAYVGAPLLEASGKPIGLMVALFRNPISRVGDIQSIISILATAIAVDMERSQAVASLRRANADLEERVRARTEELQRLVNLMAGREVRMAELKAEIRQLQGSPPAKADEPSI